MRRAAVVLLFLACAQRPEFARGERPTIARDKLPKVVQPLLPERGIYAAGGGTISAPWRIRLTLDGELRAGAAKAGASFADMSETTAKLDEPALRGVLELADRAWREKREPNLHPTADYDEILIFVDGNDAWLVEGYGPLRGGAAEELVARLRGLSGS
ncbi:MAG TPA: hypothetical protein VKE22_23220 [Haliangiales bacterium]|nr:hypothetical protein [Haliangiales bacterium]